MKRSWISILTFVLASAFILSACSKEVEPETGASGSTEKPAELVVMFPILSNIPKDLEMVQEEINKITLAKANAKVKLQPISFSSYVQQTTLMLSGSEKLDLLVMFQPAVNYPSLANKGQLIELDELLDQYGKGVKEAIGEDYLKPSQINGKLYGVPTLREFGTGFGIAMRKDLVDKYNIDISKINSLEDLEPIYKVIKENEPDIYPLFPGGAAVEGPLLIKMNATVDVLGDGLGVLANKGSELKVTNHFESEEYARDVATLNSYYEKGYIMEDAATSKDMPATLFKANKIFSAFTSTKPGQQQQDSRNYGMDIVVAQIGEPFSHSTLINGIQWGIPRNADNPQKSMEVLNLLYTDKDIVNLINYGIEGKHYVVQDNGQIALPEGVTTESSGFNWSISFETGNGFLAYTWNTDPVDLWENTKAFNDVSVKSKALGFIFDPSNVKAEVTALTGVLNQYRHGLENGALNGDKNIPKLIEKMKAAGIDRVIQEKQAQLDQWAAANK